VRIGHRKAAVGVGELWMELVPLLVFTVHQHAITIVAVARIKPVILDDDAFEAFLDAILRKTVDRLRSVSGNEPAERQVIDAYITECLGVSMSPLEIHDYFSISTPGIVGEVSASKEKQDALNALFEERMQAVARLT
jgi:hypothetical protein